MNKKLIQVTIAAVLGGCSLSAYAQETQSWTFVWSGPFTWGTSGNVANESYSGGFVARDLNDDGVILKDELISFAFNGNGILPCFWTDCAIVDFAYRGGNDLEFVTYRHNHRPRYMYQPYDGDTYETLDIANGYWQTQFYRDNNLYYSIRGEALPGVTMTVTPFIPGIPEPDTYAMMGVGLLGLAFVGRRATGKAARRAAS